MGVPLQPAVQLPESLQLVAGDIPGPRQHGVEAGRGMSLAEDQAVAVRPVRLRRVMAQRVKVQGDQYLQLGQ